MLADRRLRLLLASGILALVLGLAATAGAQTDAGEAPLPPRDVHAEDADGEKVQLTWQPPLAGEADTYHVYRLDGRTWTPVATTVNTSAIVTIGEHDVAVFHVTAANEHGESAPSKPVGIVKTACASTTTSELTITRRGCNRQPGVLRGETDVSLRPGCIRIAPDLFPPVIVDLSCLIGEKPTIRIPHSHSVRR
jgi:hypothetical protein